MIRRNFTMESGLPAWLLISQVEHAHLSSALTRAWSEPFSPEVIEAVTHHDDGWAAWEVEPQIDPQHGRPYSFLEMPLEVALSIWDGSIQLARAISPLAGAIVAGHFIGLASGSEHATQPPAARWLEATKKRRAAWLAEWHRSSPSHTLEAAEHGQQMLLTADLLSLWLCCDGPVGGSGDNSIPNSEMESRSAKVLGRYSFSTDYKSLGHDEIFWQGLLTPWPLATEMLDFASPAFAVPAARYHSWREIAAAGREVRLRWRLLKTLPAGDEC